MPIYTKTGDRGQTSLFGGKRLSKADLRVEAYGAVDELTSFLGLVVGRVVDTKDKLFLTGIQEDLYRIMAILSGAKGDIASLKKKTKQFEQQIDKIQLELPKLTRFILPQGTETSSFFHICRVVCRRAERSIVRYSTNNAAIIKYINRLSDLLFMYARKYNRKKEQMT